MIGVSVITTTTMTIGIMTKVLAAEAMMIGKTILEMEKQEGMIAKVVMTLERTVENQKVARMMATLTGKKIPALTMAEIWSRRIAVRMTEVIPELVTAEATPVVQTEVLVMVVEKA
jgi:hypothetical protein